MVNTGERLAKMETTLEYLKKEQDTTKELIRNFIEGADNKYANKIVERVVYGLVATILVAFTYAIIYIVIPGLK